MTDPYLHKKFGSVVLTQKLGQGSMGVVYKGRHDSLGIDVAVKIMTAAHHEKGDQFHQRFMREGRAASKVHHKNVVHVIDAGHEGDTAYLVLEFVSGADLGEVLTQAGCIDQATVMRFGEQIAHGLAAIHAQDIIHRDIKPENILLGQAGIIKIADLGLAKELHDESVNRLTMSGMIVGTPYYISPEAISDIASAGPATDIYSFGATMYHLLLGRPPFDGASAYEVMRAHLEQRFQPIREVDNTINPSLAALIEQCLDKDPSKRPLARDIAQSIQHGDYVQGTRSTFALIALFLIAFVGTTSLIGWKLLPHMPTQADLVIGENAAALNLQVSHRDATIRIDQYPWQDFATLVEQSADGRIALSPGEHYIRLRSYEDGVMLYWQKTITIDAETLSTQETLNIQATLVVVPISPTTIDFSDACDSSSILYINGRCIGKEHSLRIEHAGSYIIGIWNANHWVSQTISVDVNGVTQRGDWQQSAIAPPDVFMSHYLDHEKVPAHHRLTWIECEKIRAQHRIQVGASWHEQELQPLQAARNLTADIVLAVATWARTQQMGYCDDRQAHSFKQLYNHSVWYTDGGRNLPLGRLESASIILVPRAQR